MTEMMGLVIGLLGCGILDVWVPGIWDLDYRLWRDGGNKVNIFHKIQKAGLKKGLINSTEFI